MSRIGKRPINIPKDVKVEIKPHTLYVEGPKGKLTEDFGGEVDINIEDGYVVVTRKDDTKKSRSFHGLYRNLLNNMIIGVSKGFQKTLLINGVGYRVEVKGKILQMNLGYSDQIEYPIPDGIEMTTEGNNKLTISGISKWQVGQVASEIRSIRPPEPYKGKGIRYEDEHIIRKIGKAGIK